jgi:hypothetical protein
VKSVRAAVANLADTLGGLTVERVAEALAAEAASTWGRESGAALSSLSVIEALDGAALAADPDVAAYRDRLASREWRFGASPPFALRLEADGAALTLEIEGGACADALLVAAEGSILRCGWSATEALRGFEVRAKTESPPSCASSRTRAASGRVEGAAESFKSFAAQAERGASREAA